MKAIQKEVNPETVRKQLENCVGNMDCINCKHHEHTVCRHFLMFDAMCAIGKLQREIKALQRVIAGRGHEDE